jgi:hypothetical protein
MSAQGKKNSLRLIVFVIAFATLIHTVAVSTMPNAVEGSNFLGYSRGRFLVMFFSAGLTIIFFWLGRNIAKIGKNLDKIFAAREVSFGILLLLSVLLTLGMQVLIWPEHRLPAQILNYREVFGLTIVWAISVAAILAFLVLFWSASSKKDLTLKLSKFIILLLFANLRIANALNFKYPITGGDSEQYIGFTTLKIMFSYFWTGPRPFLVPLIGTLLKQDAYAFAWFQTLLSVFSWIFLAHVVSENAKDSFWKIASLATILLFSMSDRVFTWDWSILAESISFSLMALIIASWILLLRQATWPRVIFVLSISFLWAFTRDLNAWILLLVGVPLLLATLANLGNLKIACIGLVYVAIFFASSYSANAPAVPRWAVPFMHVLTFDILPNRNALDFFERSGMPAPQELLIWSGKDSHFDYLSSEFGFRSWLFSSAQVTLARYLINSIPESLYLPLNPEDGYPEQVDRRFGRTGDFKPLIPPEIKGFVYFDLRNFASITLFGLAIIYGCVKFWESRTTSWITPLVGIILSYPYGFLAWHGDAFERSRHVLPADILLRICLLILLLLVIEDIYRKILDSQSF